jgi:putative ABC transport system permease protein
VALTVVASGDRRFAIWFCIAAFGTLILFRAGGWVVMRLARMAAGVGSPSVRLGIANLYRPGAPTPLMLLSAGVGLSTLAAVALIQGNMSTQIDQQLPRNAPSFFFIDTAWALRGDRGLTYAATPPEGTHIAAGRWWPPDYSGPPLVSFDAGLAKGWGVGIGDTIRVNVLGRDIDLKVASLRDIDWRSLGINFFMVASPGLLSHAPHTHIATVKLPDNQQGALLRAVTDALPNVTGIRVQDVLGAIAGLLNQVAAALSITGGVTLLAGSFVLVGAVAAGQRRRVREAVILKTLGATRAQIRAAWLTEFGILGIVAGVIAAVVGSAASYAVMHYILHTNWIFLPVTLIYTLAGALAIMLLFGYIGTSAALRARPAPLLRNE